MLLPNLKLLRTNATLLDGNGIIACYRNSGNTILWTAFYQLIGIGQVNERIALGIHDANDMQTLE